MKYRGNKDKIIFRRSIEWKDFRLRMLKAKDYVCECCGKKMLPRYLQVHHLHPEDYTNLTPSYFAVLCHSCHEDVERLSRMKQETRDSMNQDYVKVFSRFLTNHSQ